MKIFVLARAAFVSLLFLFAANNLVAQTSASLISVTKNFLKSLRPAELQQVKHSFADTSRTKWTNLPVGLVPRPGIQYGSLSDSSRIAFHHLLTTMLSSQGYLKISSIMQLDDILNVLIKDAVDKGSMDQKMYTMMVNLKWSHDNYFISIWGEPQDKEPWGMSFGGHHVALSLTVSGGKISMTPLFLGTDPAEIKSAKYAGWRVLSKEEDYAFMLMNMLSESQRTKAILSREVPHDIITNPKSSQRINDYYGIPAKELNKEQKDMLEILIQEYIHNFEHDAAHQLYDQIIKTGLDKVYFAWIGSLRRDKPQYYIIHGPDFIIEYDDFQGDGNHIHLILREKDNDFGTDILRAHYQNSDHHKK